MHHPGRATVLIVEDEAIIRFATASMVEDAGFDVIEARTADEAMRILESRSDVQIVFTDIDMPGSMNGLKLARTVADRWPPIDLIVTSGKIGVAPADLPCRGQFLPKPYSMRQVSRALDEALAT